MKVALSTIGKFHSFDLARQLDRRGSLVTIFTGYPRFKLHGENLPPKKIKTFPWLQAPYMKYGCLIPSMKSHWEHFSAVTLDHYVARNLPDCDLFCGISGSATMSGREAKRRGIRYVCDRGSSHIRFQDQILREEYARHDLTFPGVDRRTTDREEAEYENADAITVPSTFALKTFLQFGVDAAKLRLVPYGVDLTRFQPVGQPPDGQFHIVFVGGLSLRKGIEYLLRAFDRVITPNKLLTLAGSLGSCPEPILRKLANRPDIRMLGHVAQPQLAQLMSQSHVIVLPSVEEGLALVQAQAMACRCPVIASDNTGASDLFTDGCEGFITPIRDADAIASRLQQLADDPALRDRMAESALQRTKSIGGWREYGDNISRTFSKLITS